jgi:hypothetical protein
LRSKEDWRTANLRATRFKSRPTRHGACGQRRAVDAPACRPRCKPEPTAVRPTTCWTSAGTRPRCRAVGRQVNGDPRHHQWLKRLRRDRRPLCGKPTSSISACCRPRTDFRSRELVAPKRSVEPDLTKRSPQLETVRANRVGSSPCKLSAGSVTCPVTAVES